jgi:hypothetical protein
MYSPRATSGLGASPAPASTVNDAKQPIIRSNYRVGCSRNVGAFFVLVFTMKMLEQRVSGRKALTMFGYGGRELNLF